MHPEAMEWVARHAAGSTNRTVIDLGGRDVNGTTRHLFPLADYVTVDIEPGDGVDFVCDAADFQPAEPVDCVVSTEMLEHTPRAAEVVVAAFDMLRPGGVFVGTAAGPGRPPHSAIDGKTLREGEHYENISPTDLAGWLAHAGFVDVVVDQQRRPADVRWLAYRPD